MITERAPAWCAQVADVDRLPMVIVVAVAISALADYRLPGISGSQQVSSPSNRQANTSVSVNVKHVTYETFGPVEESEASTTWPKMLSLSELIFRPFHGPAKVKTSRSTGRHRP